MNKSEEKKPSKTKKQKEEPQHVALLVVTIPPTTTASTNEVADATAEKGDEEQRLQKKEEYEKILEVRQQSLKEFDKWKAEHVPEIWKDAIINLAEMLPDALVENRIQAAAVLEGKKTAQIIEDDSTPPANLVLTPTTRAALQHDLLTKFRKFGVSGIAFTYNPEKKKNVLTLSVK